MAEIFTDNSQALMAKRDESAVARAMQEIQASLVIAQRFPRDETKARQRIMDACSRKGLAEVAEYEFSRGGTDITGPTIDLLRAIASRWGNILFGWEERDRRDGESTVRAWAWDTQSNARAERTWMVRHWRDTRSGGYKLDDERDIYEMLANNASRRLRACLEEVIDSDIITDAVDKCRATLKGQSTEPLIDRIRAMLPHFLAMDITSSEIETWAGRKLDSITESQLAKLRRIWKAIKDGVSKKEDHFKPPVTSPEFGKEGGPAAASASQKAPEDDLDLSPPVEGAKSSVAGKPATSAGAPEAPTIAGATLKEPQKLPSVVTAVRNLCVSAKVKENILLEYLSMSGATDGSVGSLEDMQMALPEVLKQVHDKWIELVPKVKEFAKAKKADSAA